MKRIFAVFVCSALFIGCEKDPTIYLDYPFHLSYTMDGKRMEYWGDDPFDTPSFANTWNYGFSPFDDTLKVNFGSVCRFVQGPSYPNFEISHTRFEDTLVLAEPGAYLDYDNFKEIFAPGERAYSIDRCIYPGVEVSYTDENLVTYTSGATLCGLSKGVNPNYANFNYEIISSTAYAHDILGQGELVVANFECVLYNFSGDSLVIENGIMISMYKH